MATPFAASPMRVLALADSGFPAGGFAHSYGLEAHASFGGLEDAQAVRRFAKDALDQAASLQGPLVCAAHALVASGTTTDLAAELVRLDRTAEVRTSSAVQNRASRTQGRTFFATASGVFPEELAALSRSVGALVYMHHAPLFGVTLASLGLDLGDTVNLFLFGQTRGILSAAVRLGLLGPHESQSLLDGLGTSLAESARAARSRPLSEAASTSPLLELRAGLHDSLYARLFLS
jgi:urease accessory protein